MDNLINLKNVTNEMDGLFDVPPVWLDLLLSVCGMVLGLLVAILGRGVGNVMCMRVCSVV